MFSFEKQDQEKLGLLFCMVTIRWRLVTWGKAPSSSGSTGPTVNALLFLVPMSGM